MKLPKHYFPCRRKKYWIRRLPVRPYQILDTSATSQALSGFPIYHEQKVVPRSRNWKGLDRDCGGGQGLAWRGNSGTTCTTSPKRDNDPTIPQPLDMVLVTSEVPRQIRLQLNWVSTEYMHIKPPVPSQSITHLDITPLRLGEARRSGISMLVGRRFLRQPELVDWRFPDGAQ